MAINREQDANRKNEAWELRIKGRTFRQIGSELGIGHATAERWVKEVMNTKSLPLAEEVRKQELDRMTRYLNVLDTRIDEGDERAVALAIKVSERLCRMLGADMPTVSVVENVETTQVDLAIQELIVAQRAMNQLAKDQAALKGGDVKPDA